jgi:hypothetical protein
MRSHRLNPNQGARRGDGRQCAKTAAARDEALVRRRPAAGSGRRAPGLVDAQALDAARIGVEHSNSKPPGARSARRARDAADQAEDQAADRVDVLAVARRPIGSPISGDLVEVGAGVGEETAVRRPG